MARLGNNIQDQPGRGKKPTPIAWLLLAPLLIWLMLFVVVPTLIMIYASFCERDEMGRVVYFNYNEAGERIYSFTLENYKRVASLQELLIAGTSVIFGIIVGLLTRYIISLPWSENYFTPRSHTSFGWCFGILAAWIMINVGVWHGFENVSTLKNLMLSINYAGISTIICILAGYPVAYFIGKSPERYRNILLMTVMIPFWTSFLVRTYAWVTILRSEGTLNSTLLYFNLIDSPLDMYPSQWAVLLGLVYTYLPFMILPIYGSIEKLDNALVEAAFDLGASPVRAFGTVIFPMTRPGVVAGILLVFVPALGMFAVNDILGGKKESLIGNVIEQQFRAAKNPPFGAALGMALLISFVITYYFTTRRSGGTVQ